MPESQSQPHMEAFTAHTDENPERTDVFAYINEPGVDSIFENSLRRSASSWEEEEKAVVPFNKRFKAEKEGHVELTSENYLASLSALAEGGDLTENEYLSFLEGHVEKDRIADVSEDRGNDKNFLYNITHLGIARSVMNGAFRKEYEKNIQELSLLQSFLEKAKQTEDQQVRDLCAYLETQVQLMSAAVEKAHETGDPSSLLPESAHEFNYSVPGSDQKHAFPDFSELLQEKIRWYLAQELTHNMPKTNIDSAETLSHIEGPYAQRFVDIANLYRENIELYGDVEEKDIPVYWESKKKIEEMGANRNVVFGRDGRFFFTALKAAGLRQKSKDDLKYVIVTTAMRNDKGNLRQVGDYLEQQGVTQDFTFIDTGFKGTVPEFALRALEQKSGVALTDEERDSRIKLIRSSTKTREQLITDGAASEHESAASRIEHRPQPFESPAMLELDAKGKLHPEKKAFAISEQIKSWTVEHASLRNFIPRANTAQESIDSTKGETKAL